MALVEQGLLTIPEQGQGQGRIHDFKLGGAFKKNRAERRDARKFWGYFV